MRRTRRWLSRLEVAPRARLCAGLLAAWFAAGSVAAQEGVRELDSPDGRLNVKVWLDDEGQPRFQLFRDGRAVILPSPLGVRLEDADLATGLREKNHGQIVPVHQRYELFTGKQRTAEYRANASWLHWENAEGRWLAVTMQLSNDGLAWQYGLDGRHSRGAPAAQVLSEATGVQFHPDTRAWLQPKAVARTGWSQVNPSYEEDYLQDIPVGTPSPSPAGWIYPALFHHDGLWMVLSEAGMNGGWPGSNLAAESPEGLYRLRFPQPEETITGGELLPRAGVQNYSPWRFLVVGELDTIMASTLGTDLAPATKLADTGWIAPGVAAWSWGLLKDDSVNFDTQKAFIDHAADLDWDYVLVDVNWDQTIGFERVGDLAAYATDKGVRLLLWYNSSGDWNETEYTPKSRLLTRADRRAEFARLQSIGIAGVKVDFFPGDGQSVMQRYLDIFADAADYGLLVNVHGSTLPRGMQRTWPNFLTSEAVKGFEFVTFTQEFADTEATHAAMLPFTRNLFDPMDYTPMTLGEIPGEVNRNTSDGFQLALAVLFTSGIQHLVATPEQVAAQPDFVTEVLRELPGRWDESHFLGGFPGQWAVIARRAGDRWWVAGISAGEAPREVPLDLSFLGDAAGHLVRDGAAGNLERTPIDTSLNRLTLAPGQGFLLIF